MSKTKSAAQLIQGHLASSTRTARLARGILEERLLEIQQDLKKPGLPRDEKGRLTLQLVEILQVIDRGVDQAAKSLLRPAPTTPVEPPTPAISPEAVLQEITRGRTKSGGTSRTV